MIFKNNLDNFIGIDIGGTKTKIILIKDNKVVKNLKIETNRNLNEFKRYIIPLVEKIIIKYNILAIGIGVAGYVKNNKLIFGPNIFNSREVDFSTWWSQIPVFVDNDARLFSLAELSLDSKLDNFLSFTIGTGVGRSLCQNKQIKKIKKFEYPEKWEKKYQIIRDSKNLKYLSSFLVFNLNKIIKKYKIQKIIFSGGLIDNNLFKKYLKKDFNFLNSDLKIIFSILSSDAVSMGAVFLAKNKYKKQNK